MGQFLYLNTYFLNKLTGDIMNIEVKPIVIIGITLLGVVGAITGQHDVLLATVSGLIGYLSKDTIGKQIVAGSTDEEEDARI